MFLSSDLHGSLVNAFHGLDCFFDTMSKGPTLVFGMIARCNVCQGLSDLDLIVIEQ